MSGFWVSLVPFVVMVAALVRVRLGMRKVATLSSMPATLPAQPPKVSIVFSALNEAATIEPALRSLMALDYPQLEIIAINDRSVDETGAILDRLARDHPALRVIHIPGLPAGWLGKTHALHVGSQAATGHYLLFTDADVVFEPSALNRAVHYCERERLDHLVVFAELLAKERLLRSLLLTFFSSALLKHPFWKVRTSPGVYLGMGAFNMVRAEAYRAAGGHEALKLEVVDDLMLGRRMKQHGFRQDVLLGVRSVMLAWYGSTGELARGLEKNSYAMIDYRVWPLLAGTLAVVLVRCWPIAGLFLTSGAAWWLNAGAIAAGLLLHAELLRLTRWSRRCLWWWPASALVMLFILWRAVLLTIRRGGIDWRGTLYALEELKRGRAP